VEQAALPVIGQQGQLGVQYIRYQADFKEVLLERGGVLYHSCSQ
jgi:hypothetical protein